MQTHLLQGKVLIFGTHRRTTIQTTCPTSRMVT